jgi:Flp pilus assembly pilin Flp
MQDRFTRILDRLVCRARDTRGVTAAEYAILAVGVVIMVGGAVLGFSPYLVNAFSDAGTAITSTQASLPAAAR